jgi:uncharacterized surface protein with fasciclin (FAS1) repeats
MALSTIAFAPTAQAASLGDDSLAAALTSGDVGFDKKSHDYDVLTAAVLAVLKAKPDSAVKVLGSGDVAVTAFLPNDRAFAALVKSLTGDRPDSEEATFDAVAGLGIDTVETVLLYHVVPGATIDRKAVLDSDGAELKTAQGGIVTVDVRRSKAILLKDQDPNARNPRVLQGETDINKGNKQIAHGIDRVLRPVDLPPLDD